MAPFVRVDCVTINSPDPEGLARFWAHLVGGVPRDAGNGFVLVDPGEGHVRLLFQRTGAVPDRQDRVHLDCQVADREDAIARVEELGGRLLERRSDSNGAWAVMTDPEGNTFCL
ncbi:hypothetical protein EDD28_0990 [Salana multivorans]|uniref:VOC domain-containing protein n=1 Tax=Salana multivorans TaxID=120377 RepID=A0A3N2D9D5_9MICO|nr:VOC family protein [Salana multivorans]ROR96406.1 hypothetical protein EDD28_0990 [Salana multivorans]